MKAEHPSTALPQSARIHFGRAYEIEHHTPVQPLGLIHATSMETLRSQFEAHVYRKGSRNEETSNPAPEREGDLPQDDSQIEPADMVIVKEMRQNIMEVLGPDISLRTHQVSGHPFKRRCVCPGCTGSQRVARCASALY